jgi:hypothetical protein
LLGKTSTVLFIIVTPVEVLASIVLHDTLQ